MGCDFLTVWNISILYSVDLSNVNSTGYDGLFEKSIEIVSFCLDYREYGGQLSW